MSRCPRVALYTDAQEVKAWKLGERRSVTAVIDAASIAGLSYYGSGSEGYLRGLAGRLRFECQLLSLRDLNAETPAGAAPATQPAGPP